MSETAHTHLILSPNLSIMLCRPVWKYARPSVCRDHYLARYIHKAQIFLFFLFLLLPYLGWKILLSKKILVFSVKRQIWSFPESNYFTDFPWDNFFFFFLNLDCTKPIIGRLMMKNQKPTQCIWQNFDRVMRVNLTELYHTTIALLPIYQNHRKSLFWENL